ncbi:MAG: MGMT family protein, partial [Brachymonas sp.]|nr:MGMT family protein [Brachymonas sp.]
PRVAAARAMANSHSASATAPPVRAVGAAVGRNPISLLIPCHRVLGKDGSLTGYAGGLDRKVALLRLEGVLI